MISTVLSGLLLYRVSPQPRMQQHSGIQLNKSEVGDNRKDAIQEGEQRIKMHLNMREDGSKSHFCPEFFFVFPHFLSQVQNIR